MSTMMGPPTMTPRRYLALAAALTLAIVVGVCLLPSDRYLRFASMTEPAVVKAGWIYERIHYDPTPIDIAFIGTSRTLFGVDSNEVESVLGGLTNEDLHVVNFALEHPGRDMHWLLARELLTTRRVRMLILEVNEDEPRDLHPAFGSLADVSDVIAAPLVINVSYFSNLIRLPGRQLSLFLYSMLPNALRSEVAFDPAWYRGAHWDDTWAERGPPRAPFYPIRPRTIFPTPAGMAQELTQDARLRARRIHLPSSLTWLEHRANIYYIHKIAALAHEKGVALNFLYLPSYHSSARPTEAKTYQSFGSIWTPPEFLSERELWSDVNHLNYNGAFSLAGWLGNELSDSLKLSVNEQRTVILAPSARR
jgi:hypothetical protein